MTNKTYRAGVLAAAGLATGCGNMHAQPTNWQAVAADAGAILTVRAEGGGQHRLSADSSGRAHEGETVHRIIRGEDGAALFSYDLVMRRTEDNHQFRLQLLPSGNNAPTFASRREVTAKADEDLVRVELMEHPQTHEKIVDVYRLASPPAAQKDAGSFASHLIQLHNRFFRWVHGS